MRRVNLPPLCFLMTFTIVTACERPPQAPTVSGPSFAVASQVAQDTALLRRVVAMNQQLAARHFGIAIEGMDFLTLGLGRPGIRIHQLPFRWVPGDSRRAADGANITYLVDQSDGATASGLTSSETEGAIDAALATWATDAALKKVAIVKRADDGTDPDIVDFLITTPPGLFGDLGNPFLADITEAGFLPRAFFDTLGGPGGGRGILAVTFTFIFVDDNGVPTDVNGDGYLDTALKEVYYNNTFGDPANDRAGNPWAINLPLPAIDVQTVALHENGHALELGHFGPPPAAVMNPVYAGIRHSPLAADDAGMNAVWGSWPNP
jgi:matrixin